MNTLQITLIATNGFTPPPRDIIPLRLTVTKTTRETRSVPLARELCRAAERETNESASHGKYGPWKILGYSWQ